MTALPTVAQIDRARTPLETAAATGVAAYYMAPYAPVARLDAMRKLYVRNLQDAARELGMELVPADGPRVVVDNCDEFPNVMG